MTPDDLKARTKKFAVDVIRFAKTITKDHINDEIASQLTDAATSTALTIEQCVVRGGTGLSTRNQQSGINNQQRIIIPESKIKNVPHLELPDDASASRLRP